MNIITVPFAKLLMLLTESFQSYGWAILVFGLVVKLIMVPFQMKSKKSMMRTTMLQPQMKELERRSRETLGRRVRITNTGKKKTIELTFENNEDLESILKTLCGNDFFSGDNF